jgi:hypothetical protein
MLRFPKPQHPYHALETIEKASMKRDALKLVF